MRLVPSNTAKVIELFLFRGAHEEATGFKLFDRGYRGLTYASSCLLCWRDACMHSAASDGAVGPVTASPCL